MHVRTARIMHDVPTAAPLVRLLRTQYPFGGCPKRRANPHAQHGTHRGVVGKLFCGIISTVLTQCSPSPHARTLPVNLGEAGGLSESIQTSCHHSRSFVPWARSLPCVGGGGGVSTSRPWMGWWSPPPRRSPPRSPDAPFTRRHALDLVGATPCASIACRASYSASVPDSGDSERRRVCASNDVCVLSPLARETSRVRARFARFCSCVVARVFACEAARAAT